MSEFVELINRHRKLIWKVCWMYGRLPQDRDDLFQEIVYQLWRAYPDFQARSEFSTWLYRVALNTAITYDGRLRRKPEETLDGRIELTSPNPIDERTELFYRALQSLNDADRALIVMHLEGLTYDEIASVLGLTNNVGAGYFTLLTRLGNRPTYRTFESFGMARLRLSAVRWIAEVRTDWRIRKGQYEFSVWELGTHSFTTPQ